MLNEIYKETAGKKRNVLCLLLVSTLSEHAISLQHHVCALYVLYIQPFTVACWESPLPSGGLSQREPDGCWLVVVRGKRVCYSFSFTKTLAVRVQLCNPHLQACSALQI